VLGEVRKPGLYQGDQTPTTIQGVAMAGASPTRPRQIEQKSSEPIRTRQGTIVMDLNDVV